MRHGRACSVATRSAWGKGLYLLYLVSLLLPYLSFHFISFLTSSSSEFPLPPLFAVAINQLWRIAAARNKKLVTRSGQTGFVDGCRCVVFIVLRDVRAFGVACWRWTLLTTHWYLLRFASLVNQLRNQHEAHRVHRRNVISSWYVSRFRFDLIKSVFSSIVMQIIITRRGIYNYFAKQRR